MLFFSGPKPVVMGYSERAIHDRISLIALQTMRLPRFPWLRKADRRAKPTHPCPQCGEPVHSGRLACKACGSDADTGWSDPGGARSADLVEAIGDFDYEAYLDREFSGSTPLKDTLRRAVVGLVILGLVISLVLWGR